VDEPDVVPEPDGARDAAGSSTHDPATDDYDWLGAEWLPDSWVRTENLAPTREVDKFRRTTAGAMLAAGMLGLQQVLEPKKSEDPPIVVDAPGEPPGIKRLEFDLDPDDPSASTVTVRPWAD
jgi:hypothetical protein